MAESEQLAAVNGFLENLRPIVCTLCDNGKYITYIEFDLELHLFTDHNIRSESRIKNAIDEGKELGLGLNISNDALQQLNENFLTHDEKSPRSKSKVKELQASAKVEAHGVYDSLMEVVMPWSSTTKNSYKPIVPVDEFFKDANKPYSALCGHSLQQSPCYPIIGIKYAGKHILYYCEICRQEFANDDIGEY
jgi:hypothetical protein